MSSIRQRQLEESIKVRQTLIEESRMGTRIDLHSTGLKRFVRKLKQEKFSLLRHPKRRRFIRLNLYSKRWRRRLTVHHEDKEYSKLNPPPNSKILIPRTNYQYKPIDGYEYGILFWMRHDDNENDDESEDNGETYMIYQVTIKFMYRLRNGLLIEQDSEPWVIPFYFASTYNSTNINFNMDNIIPIGLAALIVGLGIPDACREAMFRDISSFAPPHPVTTRHNVVTLGMEIHITTLQLESEDVLETRLRADVDRICRSDYIDLIILKNEANLEPFTIEVFEKESKKEDCCSICLEELSNLLSELPCSHIYHYNCIFRWIYQYNYCPLCRHPYQRLYHMLRSWTHEKAIAL